MLVTRRGNPRPVPSCYLRKERAWIMSEWVERGDAVEEYRRRQRRVVECENQRETENPLIGIKERV